MTEGERRMLRLTWEQMYVALGRPLDCPWTWISREMGEALREAWEGHWWHGVVPPFLAERIGLEPVERVSPEAFAADVLEVFRQPLGEAPA